MTYLLVSFLVVLVVPLFAATWRTSLLGLSLQGLLLGWMALRGETARIRQGYRPLADEHARVHAAMAALQQELESKATPRPQPFTLKLEEGVDAYPGRGPPTLSSQVMGKYTRPADPLHERDDDESFEDREFLP